MGGAGLQQPSVAVPKSADQKIRHPAQHYVFLRTAGCRAWVPHSSPSGVGALPLSCPLGQSPAHVVCRGANRHDRGTRYEIAARLDPSPPPVRSGHCAVSAACAAGRRHPVVHLNVEGLHVAHRSVWVCWIRYGCGQKVIWGRAGQACGNAVSCGLRSDCQAQTRRSANS